MSCRSIAVWAVLLAIGCAGSFPQRACATPAAPAESPRRIDIPAGDLATALSELAAQCGAQFVYSADGLKDARTSGAHGDYTPSQAAAKLLEGTHLAVTVHDSGAFLIAPPAIPPVGSDQENAGSPDRGSRPVDDGKAQGSFQGRFRLAQANSPGSPGAGTTIAGGTEPQPGLEEVVVTAQRRVQDIEKTPLQITALSGGDLATRGVVDMSGLQDAVPSLNIVERPGTGMNIAVRGLLTNTTVPQGGPSISVNVDDIFVPRTQATNANLFDVQRVEVLEGPQGTLYGKNATAGAINIITNDPGRELAANAALTIGNYGEIDSSGMLNVPLGDSVAIRGAFQTVHHHGYIGQFNDADSAAGRIKLLYTPTPDLSILLNGHYNHQGGHGPADVGYPIGPRSPVMPGTFDPGNPWAQDLYPADYGALDRTIWGIDLHAVWDAPFARFTYIFGDEVFETHDERLAQLGALATSSQSSRALSHELRISSRDGSAAAGSLTWVAGAYVFDETQSYFPAIGSGPLHVVEIEPAIPDKSRAVFGQLTYSVLAHLRITGGVRYTHDSESQNGTFTETLALPPPAPPVVLQFPISGNVTFSSVSWKAGLEADLSEHALAFASVSTGYHAGGLIDTIPANAPTGNAYRPEHVTDYELGIKSRSLDGRLQINGDVFYYDYRDLQVGVIAPPFFPTTYNAHKARLYGAELQGTWLATSADRLSVSAIYESAKYVDYCVPSAEFSGSIPVTICPDGQLGYDYSNTAFANVPRWAGTLGYRHIFDLPNGATVVPEITSRLSGRRPSGAGDPEVLPSYSNSSATLTYSARGDAWSVMAYVRNIEDEPDYTSSSFLPQVVADTYVHTLVPPRTYGVTATVAW